jgi:hypothetical protein
MAHRGTIFNSIQALIQGLARTCDLERLLVCALLQKVSRLLDGRDALIQQPHAALLLFAHRFLHASRCAWYTHNALHAGEDGVPALAESDARDLRAAVESCAAAHALLRLSCPWPAAVGKQMIVVA